MVDAPRSSTALRSFVLALVTQLSNPKTAVVYASIFAALLPAAAPTWLLLSLPLLVLALETSWYAVAAVAFSMRRPRSVYLRSKTWIDRAAGAVMGALGTRLLSETLLPRNADRPAVRASSRDGQRTARHQPFQVAEITCVFLEPGIWTGLRKRSRHK